MFKEIPVFNEKVIVFIRVSWFPPHKKVTTRYSWNIVESGVKETLF